MDSELIEKIIHIFDLEIDPLLYSICITKSDEKGLVEIYDRIRTKLGEL